MKSHANRIETFITKAEKSGKITPEEGKTLMRKAEDMNVHRSAADKLEVEIWRAIERHEE